MVADMQRLENAARLAMGDFELPAGPPARRRSRFQLGFASFLLAAAAAGLLTTVL